MEIVKKQIYLEPYISRHTSLIPYFVREAMGQPQITMTNYEIDTKTVSENGNWGMFPYDIDLSKCMPFTVDDEMAFDEPTVNPLNLIPYFEDKRVSFRELVDKYTTLRRVLDDAYYYKLITKNGELIRVNVDKDDLTLIDKLNVVFNLDREEYEEYGDGTIIGEHIAYDINGGRNMLFFLIKAMGHFVVPNTYITKQNGVPEIMSYVGITGYLREMDKAKNTTDCCKLKHFDFLGGKSFYLYLSGKKSAIEHEIKYWHGALFKEHLTDIRDEINSPYINMSVALTCETKNIGNYLPLNKNIIDEGTGNRIITEYRQVSQLYNLRRTKQTPCQVYNRDMGKYEESILPFILDEIDKNGDGEADAYKLSQPYDVGYAKNIKEGDDGEYYGDVIYKMDYVEGETNYVHIYYVLGGKLGKNEASNDFTEFKEFVDVLSLETFDDLKLSVDNYLYLRGELSKLSNYNESDLQFKGLINAKDKNTFDKPTNSTYVYKVNFNGKINDIDCLIGDFLILKPNNITLRFGKNLINTVKTWYYKDYKDTTNYTFQNIIGYDDFATVKLSPDNFLFLKSEFKEESNYNDTIIFRSEKIIEKESDKNLYEANNTNGVAEITYFTEDEILYPSEESNEIWVYEIVYNGFFGSKNCCHGDFVIVKPNNKTLLFNIDLLNNNTFSGVIYHEKKTWHYHNYTKDYATKIDMLFDNKKIAINILGNTEYVTNADKVRIIENTENGDSTCLTHEYANDGNKLRDMLIMHDYDLGKTEMSIKNVNEVIIDRGFVSTFELHYKLGEINTMEDMENYGNNFFGL